MSQPVASLGHRNRKRGLAPFLPHIPIFVLGSSQISIQLYCISREHQYASRYSNCRYFYHCLRVTTAADYWTSARIRLRSLLIDPLGPRGISGFQMTASFFPRLRIISFLIREGCHYNTRSGMAITRNYQGPIPQSASFSETLGGSLSNPVNKKLFMTCLATICQDFTHSAPQNQRRPAAPKSASQECFVGITFHSLVLLLCTYPFEL